MARIITRLEDKILAALTGETPASPADTESRIHVLDDVAGRTL